MPAPYVNTLRYWFDVEALMYPDIPKPGNRRSYSLRYTDKLPWSGSSSADVKSEHKYFVYFGLVEKNVLETELVDMFRVGAVEESFSGNHIHNARGRTFFCSIEVSFGGVPIPSSLQLSAFCIAFAERKNGKRIGYSATLAALNSKIQNVMSDSSSGRADAEWFEQVTEFLIQELDWKPLELMAREQVCIHQVSLVDAKGRKLPWEPQMDPINSFYLDDLERILLDAENGSGSRQVHAYLNGHERAAARIDVTKFDAVNVALSARRFPTGRWPSKFSLFLMQQVAVNTALEMLKKDGIFSVNGPPGTGKTTLLMDVIAARVVDRAKILVEFDNPEGAFTTSPERVEYPANASGKTFNGPCYVVDDRLLDCGIVVASANNKAVENITLDLPNLKKVYPQPLLCDGAPFDYFSAAAESILNADSGKQGQAAENVSESVDGDADQDDDNDEHGQLKCWGLVSVPLGNKKNRNRVAGRLGKFGDFGLADELAAIPASELDWNRARAKFNATVAKVVEIQDAISKFDSSLSELAAAQDNWRGLKTIAEGANARNCVAKAAIAKIGVEADENESDIRNNLKERELHRFEWPWWRQLYNRLFRGSQFESFTRRRQELSDEYDALRSLRPSLKRARLEVITESRVAASADSAAQAALSSVGKDVARLESILLGLRGELGSAAFAPAEFELLTTDEQQKSLPRSNSQLHEARAEVFVAAMQLHKAFLKNAGKPFATNFRLALSMLEQQAYLKPHLPKMAPHLWATFFLAVPVVSSTFASISRCFSDLGEGQIGLLLVDEAGQAVPSHALGAIWRSRRALIVGDPLQVEPVIAVDKKLDYGILTYHRAPEEHMLTRYSAQHLADRGNKFGANVVQYDGSDLWVGAPLRVHRRCADPMFSLSNEIAYNSKMVFGPCRDEEKTATVERPLLGISQWHDTSPSDFDEHFSQVEGKMAVDIVISYAENNWIDRTDGLPDLFLITPFKSVADGLKNALRNCAEAWAYDADEEAITKWLKDHVGTVHTFQGKESESVVFVLGGKTGGARSWAASRPNIINVAVTRAKRRLYVVGSRKNWSQTIFGEKLANAIPPVIR